MNKNKEQRPFNIERKNTDQSLVAEREKTNRSLNEAKQKAEVHTNTNVQKERAHADISTSLARTKTDAKINKARQTGEIDSADSIDSKINDERKRSDAAIELERAHIDIAIVHEREIKSVIETKLLYQERKRTDKSLAVERASSDTVVQTTTIQLSEEVAEHSKTKFNLTTRDEFLAIVSHDLRNPIGVVSSCMEMLLEEAEERNIDLETKSWLQLAKRNADSSLRLIKDILDMERIAEGKLELHSVPCDIGKVIRESIDSFVHVAASKNIILRSTPPSVSKEVVADRDRLLQILSNLIGNALKFTPDGGKVTINTEWTAENITVAINDTGPGIPENKKEQIFDKFAQLNTKNRTGLGLGLHISKMLVESHAGKLWVESKPGEGSTFFFQLPITTNNV